MDEEALLQQRARTRNAVNINNQGGQMRLSSAGIGFGEEATLSPQSLSFSLLTDSQSFMVFSLAQPPCCLRVPLACWLNDGRHKMNLIVILCIPGRNTHQHSPAPSAGVKLGNSFKGALILIINQLFHWATEQIVTMWLLL